MGMGKSFMKVPIVQPSKGYYTLWRLLFFVGIAVFCLIPVSLLFNKEDYHD